MGGGKRRKGKGEREEEKGEGKKRQIRMKRFDGKSVKYFKRHCFNAFYFVKVFIIIKFPKSLCGQ